MPDDDSTAVRFRAYRVDEALTREAAGLFAGRALLVVETAMGRWLLLIEDRSPVEIGRSEGEAHRELHRLGHLEVAATALRRGPAPACAG